MGNVYLVFDFKTPAGFLPFCYTSDTINAVLQNTILGKLDYTNLLEGTNKILTFNLDERNSNDDNIFIILVDSKLQEIHLSKILSPKLKNFVDTSHNFIVQYFDYGIEEMRALI